VLGWGVGGIEAEAAMLGQPVSMLMPEVIGFKLTGRLKEGVTATDLVLTVTQMLRKKGVVGKFVEFFGPGLDDMTLADRATIGNMAPEYGATCGFFPVDARDDGLSHGVGPREGPRLALVEAYCQGAGHVARGGSPDPVFTDTLELDLGDVVPSHGRPQAPAGPRARWTPSPPSRARWRRSSRRPSTSKALQGRGRTSISATATW
jgi:aconitate hydratase